MLFYNFQIVVDAVLAIRKENEQIDLHMVEIMEMKHKTEVDTRYSNIYCLFHAIKLWSGLATLNKLASAASMVAASRFTKPLNHLQEIKS